MNDLLNLLFKGLSLGSLYALSAMGFVLIFRAGGIVNLAHGQLMAMGAFIFLLLYGFLDGGFIIVLLLTTLICLLMILVIERLLIRPFYPIDMKKAIFVTLGIMFMFKGLIASVSLSSVEVVSKGQGFDSVHLYILAAGIVSIIILLLFYKRSSLGLYIRAVSDNRKAALSIGIPVKRLLTFTVLIAGMASAISGILVIIGSGMNAADLGPMEARIFPSIILGGLGSMTGAIMGGIIMGIIESCSGEQSGPLRDLLPYLIMLVILLIRPKGLLTFKS
ncbi:MAG: branched-chain amino acid ABC transporter permease [Deltaproteobacteria bacterium]|nr:branched-chain amino acid ABC transporter permease [Deltaproteobacteria bacterium]